MLGLTGAILLPIAVKSSTAELTTNFEVGSWIWASETHDQQLCRFWRTFEIPQGGLVVGAQLRITADNAYRLFLDGRELGRGGDWADLTEYNPALLLNPGDHVLAVEAFNDSEEAGLLVGLRVRLSNGRTIAIDSDRSWKVVPLAEKRWETRTRPGRSWPPATIVGAFGSGRWGRTPRLIPTAPIVPVTHRFWQTESFQITVVCLGGGLAVLCLHLLAKLRLQLKLQHVVERERSRIARDIHDDVSAELTELRLLGEEAQASLPPESEPAGKVRAICEKTGRLSQSLGEIVWMVNSQRDTLRSFVYFICKYAETFLQPSLIRCRLDIEEMPDLRCDLGVRRNLFLAVKEALNNAVCHAKATEITLRLRREEQNVIVAIEDNGRGFDLAGANRERNGLSSMILRACDTGGACSIVTQKGAGCRVTFTVPLAMPDQGRFRLLASLRQGWRALVRADKAPVAVVASPTPAPEPPYEPARLSSSLRR